MEISLKYSWNLAAYNNHFVENMLLYIQDIVLYNYDDQVLFLRFVMLSESEKFSLNRQKLFTESAILF